MPRDKIRAVRGDVVIEGEPLEVTLSLERFGRYVVWARDDRSRALDLYALNIRLSEALYTPLQMLEVALRNRIHSVLSVTRQPRWFEEHRVARSERGHCRTTG